LPFSTFSNSILVAKFQFEFGQFVGKMADHCASTVRFDWPFSIFGLIQSEKMDSKFGTNLAKKPRREQILTNIFPQLGWPTGLPIGQCFLICDIMEGKMNITKEIIVFILFMGLFRIFLARIHRYSNKY
jgi:hypothetical protein